MAWTTPTTRVARELITVADWNADIVNNLIYLKERVDLDSCSVYCAAGQAFSANIAQTINFANEDWDTNTMHDTVTNNTRITIKTNGRYLVIVNWNDDYAASATSLTVQLKKSGSTVLFTASCTAPNQSISPDFGVSLSAEMALAVGEYLEVIGITQGYAPTLASGDVHFSVRLIQPT